MVKKSQITLLRLYAGELFKSILFIKPKSQILDGNVLDLQAFF